MATFVILDRGLKDNIKAACFDLALLRLSHVLKQAIGIDDALAVPVTSETAGRRRGPSVADAVLLLLPRVEPCLICRTRGLPQLQPTSRRLMWHVIKM